MAKIRTRMGSIEAWVPGNYQRIPLPAGESYRLSHAASMPLKACDRCGRERPIRPDRLKKGRADICRDCLGSDQEYVRMIRDEEDRHAQQTSTEMAS